jgi:manganese/iron transport system permease protein
MSEVLQYLLHPLQYEYMLRAIWVSALVGGVCGFLSSFVTLKGWSLMGDALSHAVVPGVAIAYLLGLPFALGAFVAAILATGAMAFIRAQSRIREDATIGIVDLKVILYGNILGIAVEDVVQLVVIAVVVLCLLGLKWRDLMLYCFDANQVRALRLNPMVLHMILLGSLAAVSVAALQAVGAILVLAMLVTPGATAYLLTDRFGRMIWISSGLGIVTSMLGAYGSYFLNGATGGCIVSLQTIVFIGVFVFAPKHGFLANRRDKSRQEIHAEEGVS